MRTARLALAAAALLTFSSVQACGVCNEDKIAATYDHAVVRRANLQGRVIVVCEVRGALDSRWLKTAASRLKGVDPASLRISANPATLSFALDSRQQSPQAAVDALQAMAGGGTQVVVVRLPGSPAAPLR